MTDELQMIGRLEGRMATMERRSTEDREATSRHREEVLQRLNSIDKKFSRQGGFIAGVSALAALLASGITMALAFFTQLFKH